MNMSLSRRILAISTSAILCTGIGGTMSGCETTQLRNILGTQTAIDLLSPFVRDAANAYISDLTSLTGMLDNIDSLQGVIAFVRNIQPTIDKLTSAYQTLSDTTGDERRWLLEAFGPQIKSVNEQFISQSEELSSVWAWKKALEPALDQIHLFGE